LTGVQRCQLPAARADRHTDRFTAFHRPSVELPVALPLTGSLSPAAAAAAAAASVTQETERTVARELGRDTDQSDRL